MKTNFLMLKELLEKYHPEERGFVSYDEKLLIEKTLRRYGHSCSKKS